VKDRVNFGELSRYGINTTKKVTTIMCRRGGLQAHPGDVRHPSDDWFLNGIDMRPRTISQR